MAPDPAWAETVRAVATQTGSWAAETGDAGLVEVGLVDVGLVDLGTADAPAAVVGTGPTEARRADGGAVEDGAVDDVRADAAVVARARALVTVVGSEADELTEPVTCGEADRPELHALAKVAMASRPIAAHRTPPREEEAMPVQPPGRGEPPGIS